MSSSENDFWIDVPVIPYASIGSATEKALIIANWHQKAVRFTFEGTTIIVLPNDKVRDIVKEWVDFSMTKYLVNLENDPSPMREWSKRIREAATKMGITKNPFGKKS